jgi:hypothetical protein
MLTQNANESFNAQIWKRCPKTEFSNRCTVETTVALATLSFNCGPIGIKLVMDELGLCWGVKDYDFAKRKFNKKVNQARKKTVSQSKWKRKHRKGQNLKQNHNREQVEGTTYSPGAFTLEDMGIILNKGII